MKELIVYLKFVLFLSGMMLNAQSGCIPTALEPNIQGFVCSDGFVGSYNNKKYKIRFNTIDVLNKLTISTVGESDVDTELYLYDDLSGAILAYNDNDVNCGGCKQSTIIYQEPVTNVLNLYVVVAQKGCASLTLPTKVKFSARNDYNSEPKILSPISVVQCVGNTTTFTYDPLTTTIASPWLSLTPSVVTIDATTGEAAFLTTGIAKIELKGSASCNIINNYIVKGSTTSSISH